MLAGACLISILLLFVPPILYGVQSSHDVLYHLSWFESYRQALRDGMVYPRWLPDQMDGMGSPVLYFYPPFTSFFCAAIDALTWHRLGADRVLAVAACVLALASAASFYVWLREGPAPRPSPNSALCLSSFYAIAPYHLLIDLYTRAAIAEYAAYVWVPLIFTALRCNARQRHVKWQALLSVSTAGLLVTHLLTALMVAPVAALYALLAPAAGTKPAPLGRATSAALVGAGLGAIYWLPALTLLEWTNRAALLEWPIADSYFRSLLHAGAASQTLKRTFFIACAYLGLAGYFFAEYRAARRSAPGAAKPRAHGQEPAYIARLWLAVICAAYVAMSGYASFLFHDNSPYRALQFAWRLLSIVEFACISLAALAIAEVTASDGQCSQARRRSIVVGLTVFAMALAGQAIDIALKYRKQYRQQYPVMTSISVLTRLSPLEYFPDKSHFPRAPEQMLARLRRYTSVAEATCAEPVRCRLIDVQRRGSDFTLLTSASMPMHLTLRQFYFPGWQALDQQGRALAVHAGGADKLVAIDVPPGLHRIRVRRIATTPERAGAMLSLVSLLLLAGQCLRQIWPTAQRAPRIERR